MTQVERRRSGPVSGRTTERLAALPVIVEHPTWMRYGAAALAVIIASLVTFAFSPYLARVLFLFYWPAVLFSSWYGGFGPAIAASILSVLAADFLFVKPIYHIGPVAPEDLVAMSVFAITSTLVSSLTESLRRERRRAVAHPCRMLHDHWQRREPLRRSPADRARPAPFDLRHSISARFARGKIRVAGG